MAVTAEVRKTGGGGAGKRSLFSHESRISIGCVLEESTRVMATIVGRIGG